MLLCLHSQSQPVLTSSFIIFTLLSSILSSCSCHLEHLCAEIYLVLWETKSISSILYKGKKVGKMMRIVSTISMNAHVNSFLFSALNFIRKNFLTREKFLGSKQHFKFQLLLKSKAPKMKQEKNHS